MLVRRRVLLVVLVVCGCWSAAVARATEGIFLSWNDCPLGAASAQNFASTCLSNVSSQNLYCAFRMPFPADSVLGVEIVVDVQHANETLPDWWRLDHVGCRAGELRALADFPPTSACVDFFQDEASSDLLGFYLTAPHGGSNQASIRMAASLLPSAGYAALDSSSMYLGGRLNLTNLLTVGTTSCAGCLDPACLVLNSILVRRQPGATGGDVFLSVPGEANANWATWQGGTGANCAAVPVRPMTWGRLKGLYR